MGDSEFEEFRKTFDRKPTFVKTTAPFYSIVPNLDEDSPTSKSDSSDQEESTTIDLLTQKQQQQQQQQQQYQQSHAQKVVLNVEPVVVNVNSSNGNDEEDDEIGDGLRTMQAPAITTTTTSIQTQIPNHLERTNSLPFIPGQIERRRRKLPEIPKNRKLLTCGQTSLADEMGMRQLSSSSCNSISQRSLLARKCSYLLDEDSSSDSEQLLSLGDVDSGHSTAHSPTDLKSLSPQINRSPSNSPYPSPFGGVRYSQLEMLEATHRALHKFIPRHHDEIEVEIGDPIYVQKEAEDLWCEGVNLRTGRQGIFPSAYAVDLEYNDFDPNAQKVKKERYLLDYLGSVETLAHKGTGVVCQAVRKIVGECSESSNSLVCILEISDQGLRMVQRACQTTKDKKQPCFDYFYSLKNVSFCAFHPRDHRYIGFITKHPTIQRFACHVFKGQESTRPVAEAVGRAFQHFYQKFIETAYPIEDIYIE